MKNECSKVLIEAFSKKYYFFVSNHLAPKNVKVESHFFPRTNPEKNLTLSGTSGGLVGATTLSMTTVSITTLSIMTSCIILSVFFSERRVFSYCYARCH
jgi:hypothetical protein